MADVERIRNTLLWRGFPEYFAKRYSIEIGKNLDNYLSIYDIIEEKKQQVTRVYDNHTVPKPLRSPRLEAWRANL